MASRPTYNDKMRQLREDPATSRAGTKWTDEENTYVSMYVKAVLKENDDGYVLGSFDYAEMASHLKRTPNSVTQHLLKNILSKLELDDKLNKDDVCKENGISVSDFNDYYEREKNNQKRRASNASSSKEESKQDLLSVIQDLKDSNRKLVLEVARLSAEISNLSSIISPSSSRKKNSSK